MILTEADRQSLKQTIRDDMGPALLALLADPDVIDIHANPDGRVWIDTLQGRKRTDLALESSHIELIIRHVAAYHGRVCNEEHPDLMAVFPLGGERFQGERLPISAPSFTIRKHLQQVLSLSDLIEQGALTVQHANILLNTLRARKNIIVAGMTLSGKTVLIDTLLSEYPTLFGPAVRVITIEDTRELLGAVDNIVMKEASPQRSVQDLIRNTLRQSPDILVLGEARGKEMDALLSMWLSGHGGSVCSLHAGSPREAMLKMEMAVEEGKPKADPRRIAAVVHLVVVTERRASDKWGVKEMTRVVGWKEGEYLFASAEEGGGTMSSNP